MQLQTNAPEIKTIYEQRLFNGKDLHVFIYSKTKSISGPYRHNYYEFTPVLTRRYYQEINGERMLLEHGDFVFIPLESHYQSFYDPGTTRILNAGTSKRFFEQHYHPLLPFCFAALQICRADNSFLTYTETVIAPLSFRKSGLDEFIKAVTFYVINWLRHRCEEQVLDDILQWLKIAVETTHDKRQFSENVLENMVHLSAKSQEYLTRTTRRYYSETPMQIISEVRINFAKKQLEMTNYSVTDTVYESSCSSLNLFTKTFKKLTSFTSNNYRKKLTEFSQ